MRRSTLLTLPATAPGLAWAHGPAEAGFLANLGHVLSSPGHLWPLAAVVTVVTVAGAVKLVRRRRGSGGARRAGL